MKDGKSDPMAGSLIDQGSSGSDSGRLVGWNFFMVRRLHYRWCDMLWVTPLAIANQAGSAWLHFSGEISCRSREALFCALSIWGLSYIVFALSLGMYRKDWCCSVSLNWERVILLILLAEGVSPAAHTKDAMLRENMPMRASVTGDRSFCSARWL